LNLPTLKQKERQQQQEKYDSKRSKLVVMNMFDTQDVVDVREALLAHKVTITLHKRRQPVLREHVRSPYGDYSTQKKTQCRSVQPEPVSGRSV
jgi:SUMO ligase MMS21 Smc5/6 complex component